MSDLQKYKLEEEIYLAYLTHRGVLKNIKEALPSIPLVYIQQIIKKIDKRQRNDVTKLVADTAMKNLFNGRESRIKHLMDVLQELREASMIYNTACINMDCSMRRVRIEQRSAEQYNCTVCNKLCEIQVIRDIRIYNLTLKTIESLKLEDVAMVDFMDKLGFTNKIQQTPLIQKNNTLILQQGSGSNVKEEVVAELDKLSPMDREKIIKSLEAQIVFMDDKNGQSK